MFAKTKQIKRHSFLNDGVTLLRHNRILTPPKKNTRPRAADPPRNVCVNTGSPGAPGNVKVSSFLFFLTIVPLSLPAVGGADLRPRHHQPAPSVSEHDQLSLAVLTPVAVLPLAVGVSLWGRPLPLPRPGRGGLQAARQVPLQERRVQRERRHGHRRAGVLNVTGWIVELLF